VAILIVGGLLASVNTVIPWLRQIVAPNMAVIIAFFLPAACYLKLCPREYPTYHMFSHWVIALSVSSLPCSALSWVWAMAYRKFDLGSSLCFRSAHKQNKTVQNCEFQCFHRIAFHKSFHVHTFSKYRIPWTASVARARSCNVDIDEQSTATPALVRH
jgi:hypothetical protein